MIPYHKVRLEYPQQAGLINTCHPETDLSISGEAEGSSDPDVLSGERKKKLRPLA